MCVHRVSYVMSAERFVFSSSITDDTMSKDSSPSDDEVEEIMEGKEFFKYQQNVGLLPQGRLTVHPSIVACARPFRADRKRKEQREEESRGRKRESM